jgi:DNA-binding NarL/FixJ family response regulator
MAHSSFESHIQLTRTEAETLLAILDLGLTNAGLAEHFGVSESTIASRLHRIYERTGLAGRTQAVAFAALHRSCCLLR